MVLGNRLLWFCYNEVFSDRKKSCIFANKNMLFNSIGFALFLPVVFLIF